MRPGQRFRFVIDPPIAGRMDRVVIVNDGRVLEKTAGEGGVLYLVEKT